MEILSVKQLSLRIGQEEKIIDESFSVCSGDVILLTGPNGCGKSTLIKTLMGAVFNYRDISFTCASALFKNTYEVLHSESANELFRKNVCYISQEDEFESDSVLDCFVNAISYSVKINREKYVLDFIKQFDIPACFNIHTGSFRFDRKCRHIASKAGIDIGKLSDSDAKAIHLLAMNTRRMSGGQKKLINIFSNLIRYSFCDLLILDEPLNNLDYNNVRSFSNVLTRIYKSKPEIAILLVTHCRSIPIINRVLAIDTVAKRIIEEKTYSCNTCFGSVDENGFYR